MPTDLNINPQELLARLGVKQLIIERQDEVIELLERRIGELEAKLAPLASAEEATDNAGEQPAADGEGESVGDVAR